MKDEKWATDIPTIDFTPTEVVSLSYDLKFDLLERLIGLAHKPHNSCEDAWYSCPKSPEGCNNDAFEDGLCNCGADDHNNLVDQIAEELRKLLE